MLDDPFDQITELAAELKKETMRTPAGKGRPFKVVEVGEEEMKVRTSAGGRVTLRREVFQVAEQILRDLGEASPGGWVPMKDEVLDGVVRGQNGDACSSYVFPLLERLGKVEIDRGRPVKFRLKPAG